MLEALTPKQILTHYGLTNTPSGSTFKGLIAGHFSVSICRHNWRQILGLCLMLVAFGGFLTAVFPFFGLEVSYLGRGLVENLRTRLISPAKTALAKPAVVKEPELNPLVDPAGKPITPVNSDFSLIIPKIGVNASVVAGVSPASTAGYNEALKKGVAHSSTSFYPNENGTVYLFSHSTNYEWFVRDLNAVFYLIKNLDQGDLVVVMYLGDRYTYKIREKQIVSAHSVSYLKPQTGSRNLILQTCWPPGTSYQRLLIFADLVEAKHYGKFDEILY